MTAVYGAAALLLVLVTSASCSDDLPTGRDPKLDGGVLVGDGGAESAQVACPESEPKVGEGCPIGFLETSTCTYVVGMCMIPSGAVHNEYLTYCCSRGTWASCGGMSVCDFYDGGVPPALDAPPAVDTPAADGGAGDAEAADAAPDAGTAAADGPDADAQV